MCIVRTDCLLCFVFTASAFISSSVLGFNKCVKLRGETEFIAFVFHHVTLSQKRTLFCQRRQKNLRISVLHNVMWLWVRTVYTSHSNQAKHLGRVFFGFFSAIHSHYLFTQVWLWRPLYQSLATPLPDSRSPHRLCSKWAEQTKHKHSALWWTVVFSKSTCFAWFVLGSFHCLCFHWQLRFSSTLNEQGPSGHRDQRTL